MGIARTLGLAGILLALFAAPARAGDGDDAAAWLRKAKAAESIDHDPVKAVEHYRQALAAPGATAAGLEAGMRLVELLEAAGDAKGALATARELSQRFVPVLDEPTKERVLDALGRLLPPGSKERTPLGLVVVPGPAPAAAEAEPSPLVRRFEDAFRDVSTVDPRSGEYTRWRAELLNALRSLGMDALPVLEWNIRSENMRKSTEAMQLLTVGFPIQCVPLLERLALDADVLVRRPALAALRKLPPSPAKGLALDRLRKAATLQSEAVSIREQLRAELDEAALLALHAAGGPEALDWLQSALQRGSEPALRRALEVGAKDRAPVRDGLVTLAAGGSYATASTEARRDLEAFLRADPEAETNPEIEQGLASLAAAHVYDVPESDVAGRAAARRAAWARIAEMKAPGEVVAAMKALSLAVIQAPADLFTDARWTAAFVSGWHTLAVRDDAGSLEAYVEPGALGKAGPFWAELATRLLADAAKAQKLLQLAVEATEGKVPADLVDPRWVQIAARDVPAFATVTNAARFLATAAVEGSQRPHDALTEALPAYRGPGLVDLLTDLVGRELPWVDGNGAVRARWNALLTQRARGTLTPAALIDWIRRTRDDRPVAASLLVEVLGTTASRAEIVALLREEGSRTATLAPDYAGALVELAHGSKSPDALPMLLRIYRENGDEDAANAMSMIRQYLDKLKDLEGSTRQAEDAGTEVEESLLSPDAGVRRAGVQAIVVLEHRAAIARLLKLIRSEKDASVLEEANAMLRKLSKAILDGTPPAPGAPDVHYYRSLEFGPDGKPLPPPGKTPPAPAAPTPAKDAAAPGR